MKLTAFFLLAVLVSFAACRRDIDERVLSNTQISKTILLYPWQPTGLDTGSITEYKYDVQDRLIQTIQTYQPSTPSQSVTTKSFYYRGSDDLPYETTAYSDSPDGTKYRDTTFFWYENGIVSADSAITDIDYPSPFIYKSTHIVTAKTFINNGNTTTINTKIYDLSFAPYVSVCDVHNVSDKVYLNGNISSEQTTTTYGISCVGSSSTPSTRNVQVFYDDKPSCFKGITPVYPSLAAGFSNYSQQNNMVEYIDAGGHTKRTYTYRADGYPVSYLSLQVGSSIFSQTLIFYRE